MCFVFILVQFIKERGRLCLIEQVVSDDETGEDTQDDNNTQLVEVIKDDFREFAPLAIRENDYVTNLVVNVFVPSGGAQLSIQSRTELENEKKELQDIHSSSLESFAKAKVRSPSFW